MTHTTRMNGVYFSEKKEDETYTGATDATGEYNMAVETPLNWGVLRDPKL